MPLRKFYRKLFRTNSKRGKFFLFLKLSGFFGLLAIFCFLLIFIYYANDLPRPEKFTEKHFIESTKIYDRTGEVLLYEIYGEEKRTIVSLSQISENMQNAVIAVEDKNFRTHPGIDLLGSLRSVLKDLKIGQLVYGGSTIPQQLIRSTFLSLEKTAGRKIKEIVLALELDRRYSKDEILEWYLNQVPFGPNYYGVESVSQSYFRKSASELSLAESACLAAMIQSPSRLNPFGPNLDKLLSRKDYVLNRMRIEGYISEEEAEEAKNEIIKFSRQESIKAPHFVIYVIENYLKPRYGEDLTYLKENGLKIYTSLDWDLQQHAEKAIKEGVERNKVNNAHNAGLIAIDPRSGQILAMVGSKDWYADPYPEGCSPGKNCMFEPSVNVTSYGEGRQPGSSFKPFAYAEAFKELISPDTVVWDVKTEFSSICPGSADQDKNEYGTGCYHPGNYDGTFRGAITLRNALAQSINIPAIKVLYLAGVEKTINLAKSMGITTLNKPLSWYGLSLVLGGGEVKLLDLTSAYGTFATEGLSIPPASVLKTEDSNGNILTGDKKTLKRVLDVQTSRLITDILSDNEARAPMFGYYSSLYFSGYDVAVKTGTTQDYRDAWTVGYTPFIACGVWVGNNNNTPMAKKASSMISAPIWRDFMEKALAINPKQDFIDPDPISENKLSDEVLAEPFHSLLYYINQNSPQYQNWEEGLLSWLILNNKIQSGDN